MKKHLIIIVLALLTLHLSGCMTAQGARSQSMMNILPVVSKQHPESVSVKVSGGKQTNPLWTSQISNEDFEAALIATINNSKVFSTVMPSPQGDVLLEVTLVELKQPMFGIDMTVTAGTTWVLRNRHDSSVIWQSTINKAYTATFGDTALGYKRLQLANEGAIKEVIKEGISALSQLRLK